MDIRKQGTVSTQCVSHNNRIFSLQSIVGFIVDSLPVNNMASDAFVCLSDFEQYARSMMPKFVFSFYSGGADDEVTLRDSVRAFQRYQIIPRVLRDVSKRDTGTTILGHPISFPVCVSPSALHGMAHPDGEIGSARGVMSMKTAFTLSSYSSRSIDEVADAASECLLFFQFQFFYVRDLTLSLVQWAERRGFKALVLTVDIPVLGKRVKTNRIEKEMGYSPQFNFLKFGNMGEHLPDEENNHLFNDTVTWEDVKWLKSQTKLPIIMKGILTAADAVIAVEHGVSAILVSNHGGRQLDTVPATLDVLGDVVKAVRGRCEVYVDSGVRRGTDVFKALALGARAVFIGRPVIYALHYKGAEGVRHMLQLLKDEFSATMALTGCTSVNDINESMIVRNPLIGSNL